MNAEKLKEILDKHLHWIHEDVEGWQNMRADLSRADLSGANLSRADLSGANLYGADLSGADLSGADLSGANLSGANLYGANLYGVDLSGADLSGADLSGAKIELELFNKFFPVCCPEVGSFIGWKKCRKGLIVKLRIPEEAKRSSAYGRKCRCSAAEVLAIEYESGDPADTDIAESGYNAEFKYKVGEFVKVDNFDGDRRNECSTGIHFFITRKEAVDYVL